MIVSRRARASAAMSSMTSICSARMRRPSSTKPSPAAIASTARGRKTFETHGFMTAAPIPRRNENGWILMPRPPKLTLMVSGDATAGPRSTRDRGRVRFVQRLATADVGARTRFVDHATHQAHGGRADPIGGVEGAVGGIASDAGDVTADVTAGDDRPAHHRAGDAPEVSADHLRRADGAAHGAHGGGAAPPPHLPPSSPGPHHPARGDAGGAPRGRPAPSPPGRGGRG